MIQVDVVPVNNAGVGNTYLRAWQHNYPKRKIVGVSLTPNDYGWFMTITYEAEMRI